MAAALHILLTLFAVALLVPAVTLFVECAAATPRRRPEPDVGAGPRPRLAVVIPARDEAPSIEAAIASVRSDLAAPDRLIVVAHACRDDTAEVARRAGAEVIEHEVDARGKGLAIERGLQHLDGDPPEVVAFVDADCVVEPGTLDRLARTAAAKGRPVQASYLIEAPASPAPLELVSAFAILVRNVVRPEGLRRLGMPCHLAGSGMAFPWAVIRALPLAREHLVEDLQLGVDAALAGQPPTFCREAVVKSRLPSAPAAHRAQRRRWEHGHLATAFTRVPELLGAALVRRRAGLFAMALDLGVPPLSSLIAVVVAVFGLAVVEGALLGQWLPAWLAGATCALVAASITLAWVGYGRGRIPLRTLLVAPVYVVRKLPLYLGFLFRRQRSWVRTEQIPHAERDDDAPEPP